jgi:hypothetical protein
VLARAREKGKKQWLLNQVVEELFEQLLDINSLPFNWYEYSFM